MMNDIVLFKKEIFKTTLIIAGLSEVMGLVVVGILYVMNNINFMSIGLNWTWGLAAGTIVAIINFNILAKGLTRAVTKLDASLFGLNFIVRMIIYGVAFFVCLKAGHYAAGIGSLVGFMTLKVALLTSESDWAKNSLQKRADAEAKKNDEEAY